MKLKRWLNLYKPQELGEKAATADRVLIGLGFFTALLGISIVISILLSDSKIQARVPFKSENWLATFASSEFCKKNEAVGESCLASMQNPTLWASEVKRDSSRFKEYFENLKPPEYWFGKVVTIKDLKLAAEQQASVLIFSPVHGISEVFVDGIFISRHGYLTQSLPLQISIPQSRLEEDKDLHIAIRVSPYPLYAVSQDTSVEGQEGFFDAVSADRLMLWKMFFGLTRHLIALGLFLILARILWSASAASRGAYDYIAGAQFALVMALISVASVDLMHRVIIVSDYYRIYFILMLWEAVFLIRMTMAFLRASRHFSKWQAIAFSAASILAFFLVPPIWIENYGMAAMTKGILPITYALCALILSARTFWTRKQRQTDSRISRERLEFLLFASSMMWLTAASYLWEATHNPGLDVHWSRLFNVVTIYLLVRIITGRQSQAFVTKPALVSTSHDNKKAA
ncbi:MAG: hypothetical protein AB7O96_01210 [Pseudobdellovibrionaceae bacterium]